MSNPSKAAQVATLLSETMHTAGCDQRLIQGALALWDEFIQQEPAQTLRRKVAAYAAGCEYLLSLTEGYMDHQPTQRELAERYAVSSSTVSQVYWELSDALGFFSEGELAEPVSSPWFIPFAPELGPEDEHLLAPRSSGSLQEAERLLEQLPPELRAMLLGNSSD
jgi:hypothetical protein